MSRGLVFLITIGSFWVFLISGIPTPEIALGVGIVVSIWYGRWAGIAMENDLRRHFGYPEFDFWGKVKK